MEKRGQHHSDGDGSPAHSRSRRDLRRWLAIVGAALCTTYGVAACGGAPQGQFELFVGGTGAAEDHLEFEISKIHISNDGDTWWTILDLERVFNIVGDDRGSFGLVRLDAGEYRFLKVEIGDLFVITLADDTRVQRHRPDLLIYLRGEEQLQATEENGFEETTRFFLFSVDNGTLADPITVEEGRDGTDVELTFEPIYPVEVLGERLAALAGGVTSGAGGISP